MQTGLWTHAFHSVSLNAKAGDTACWAHGSSLSPAARQTRINVTYSFLSRFTISSLLSSCIRIFNTSGWFWKINKRSQPRHVSHSLVNVWLCSEGICHGGREKIHFLLGTGLRPPSGGDQVNQDQSLEDAAPSGTAWTWPGPLSFGHIPLRPFFTLPTSHD